MKSAFAQLATAAVFVAGALAQSTFQVNTPPNAVVCQPLLISWSGGTPPYFLSILPGNQPGAAAIVDFGEVGSVTSMTWTVNQPANTLLGINLRDSTGVLVQSAAFPVNAGADTSCLNASSSSSSSAPVTGSGSSSSGSSAPPSSTTSASTTPSITSAPSSTRPSTSATSTSRSASAPANTTSSAASGKFAQIGLTGVVGAVAALIMT